MKENKVAKTLKAYAILNAIGAVLVAIALNNNLPMNISSEIAWVFFFASAFVSFLIYSFGEVIQLLQDIKNTTKPKPQKEQKNEQEQDEIPDI